MNNKDKKKNKNKKIYMLIAIVTIILSVGLIIFFNNPNIKNKEQKEIVKTLTKDQEITIRGKITDVGEVLGYYLDINEIIAN